MSRESRTYGPRKASSETRAERAADEELARTLISQIIALEARGALLPAAWRDKRPMTLKYLSAMLNLAMALLAARRG